MTDLQKKLIEAFSIEYIEYTNAIQAYFNTEDQNKESDQKLLLELRRYAHSLKGAARAVGFNEIIEPAYSFELLFSTLINKNINFDSDFLRLAIKTIEYIECACKKRIESQQIIPNPESVILFMEKCNHLGEAPDFHKDSKITDIKEIFFKESDDHLEKIYAFIDLLKSDRNFEKDKLMDTLRIIHTLKGASRAVGFKEIIDLCHQLETEFVDLNKDGNSILPEQLQRIIQLVDDIVEIIKNNRTNKNAILTKDSEVRNEFIMVNNKGLANLEKSINSFIIDSMEIKKNNLVMDDVFKMMRNLNKNWEDFRRSLQSQSKTAKNTNESNVYFENMNSLTNEIQSLYKNIRYVRQRGKRIESKINIVSENLRKNIILSKMVSAQEVFPDLRSMVKTLAKDENKEINVIIQGYDTLADRMIFQEMRDSIIHILRNSVHHGIGSSGNITIIFSIIKSMLNISIKDDGIGIDMEKVKKLALEKKILDRDNAQNKANVIKTLFSEDFSTADSVSNLSGRGMGLSIVSKTVKKLQGSITVDSNTDKGTVIELYLPITITSLKGIVCKCDDFSFALPAYAIEKILKISLKDLQHIDNNIFLKLKDSYISVFNINKLMHINNLFEIKNPEKILVIIIKTKSKKIALAIDEVIEETDCFLKELPPFLKLNDYYLGGFISKEGFSIPVLNPEFIIPENKEGKLEFIVKKHHTPPAVDRAKRILIVDDSITTRTLEKTILEGNGYEVQVSLDGIDALQRLKTEEIDLIITDIQMPRMDGFELVKNIKKIENIKNIPLIIVSSFDDPADREKGLDLGADAYIVKQQFEQQKLLDTIKQII